MDEEITQVSKFLLEFNTYLNISSIISIMEFEGIKLEIEKIETYPTTLTVQNEELQRAFDTYNKTLTIEGYIKYKNRFELIHLNTLLEAYLFNCCKYHIEQHKDILDCTKILFKDLRTKDTETIIDEKIEKYLNDAIMYGDYTDIFEKIKRKLKLNQIERILSDEVVRELNELSAKRNLVLHRNGRIDRKYIQKIHDDNSEIGDKLQVDSEYIKHIRLIVMTFAIDFDNIICELYPNLKTSLTYYYT